MADITVTAANVLIVSGTPETVQAGATITAGQTVYKDTADSNEYKACDADASGTASCDGIALTGSSDGQKLVILSSGTINLGATLAVGKVYVVSSTAGGIMPVDDIGGGEFITVLGVSLTAANLKLNIINSATAADGAVA